MTMTMETIRLNDNYNIPSIGYGTYKATGEEGIDAISKALQTGYRLIDTAAVYRNEAEVGQAILKSGIPRDEIFLTSKLPRNKLGYESAKAALEKSLDLLQTEYLDLYLIHWPANARHYEDWKQVNSDTWRALEESQKEGKIRSIGVSNFWEEHLDPLLATCEIIPAVNQIEFHPGYWQPEVNEYCKEKGILVEAWAPLAKGQALKNGTIRRIAKRYKKTEAQICLRWAMDHGTVPIPKTTTPERIKENFDVFGFNLSKEDSRTIDLLPQMGFSGELPNEW